MSKKSFNTSLIFIALGFVFLATICIRTISTPEIWTHLAQGRVNAPISFVEADNSVNTTWLYDKVTFFTWKIGKSAGLILLNTLLILAAFFALLKPASKWGGAASQGFALLIAGHLIFPGVDVGPQSVMMLFIALFVAILSDAKKPVVLFGALLPIQLLWTNMHGSFLFGPILALLATLQCATAASSNRKKTQTITTGTLGGLTAALLAITLLNPYFFRLHSHVLANIMAPFAAYDISLFRDYFAISANTSLITLAMVIGAGGLITLKKRLPFMLTTLAIFGAVLMMVPSAQMMQLFAILTFPFIVLSFSAIGTQLMSSLGTIFKQNEKVLNTTTQVILAVLLVFSMVPVIGNCAYTRTGSASRFGLGIEEEQFASGLEEMFNHPAFPAANKTLNMAADGGYIAWTYNRKIFLDLRPGHYPKEARAQFNRLLFGEKEAYNAVSDKYRPEAFIINTLSPLSAEGLVHLLAMRQPRWKLAYFDGTTAVVLLDKPELAPLLKNKKLQQAGLAKLEKARAEYAANVAKGCRTGNPVELIGAGKVFLALNRVEESKAIFSLLLQGESRIPAAWIGLGVSQLMLKEFDSAIQSLQKALEYSPNSLQAWANYRLAQKYAGNDAEYQRADQRVKELQAQQQAEADKKKEKEAQKTAAEELEGLTKKPSINDLIKPE